MFVPSWDEEMSALEAVGYAKSTGRLGVCMATSGPGATHLLNGLYDAKLATWPSWPSGGQTNRSAMDGSYQQKVDLLSLHKDIASEYEQMVTVPEQLLGAGVAKPLLGKDVLSDELPHVTGTRSSYEMMMGCDTLLTVGPSSCSPETAPCR